jgi:hypothetical protein
MQIALVHVVALGEEPVVDLVALVDVRAALLVRLERLYDPFCQAFGLTRLLRSQRTST